jgi:CRP/FNR family transcriptional regulator, cyclic AMP receptor protein
MGRLGAKTVNLGFLFDGLKQNKKAAHYRRNDTVYSCGDRGNEIFFIRKGHVKLALTSDEGKEAVISVLDGGHLIGESSLSSDIQSRTTGATALTEVEVLRIERDALMKLIHDNAAVCDAILSFLICSRDTILTELADNILYISERRLARAILSRAISAEHHGYQHVPKLSQQDWANMIGVTRQRINALMRKFRQLGYIDDAEGLRVHSSIVNIAGED